MTHVLARRFAIFYLIFPRYFSISIPFLGCAYPYIPTGVRSSPVAYTRFVASANFLLIGRWIFMQKLMYVYTCIKRRKRKKKERKTKRACSSINNTPFSQTCGWSRLDPHYILPQKLNIAAARSGNCSVRA